MVRYTGRCHPKINQYNRRKIKKNLGKCERIWVCVLVKCIGDTSVCFNVVFLISLNGNVITISVSDGYWSSDYINKHFICQNVYINIAWKLSFLSQSHRDDCDRLSHLLDCWSYATLKSHYCSISSYSHVDVQPIISCCWQNQSSAVRSCLWPHGSLHAFHHTASSSGDNAVGNWDNFFGTLRRYISCSIPVSQTV